MPWTKRLNKLSKLGGVFKMPEKTLANFKAEPALFVTQALTKVVEVLQPDILDLATQNGVPFTWEVLQCGLNWLQHGHAKKLNICMPFNKAKVSKKRKRAELKCKHLFIKDGYLRVLCGYDAAGANVYEFAHRLVCFAFNGAPPDMQHKVVSHMCHNPCCLNPRHMKWDTIRGNLEEGHGAEDV